MKDVIEQIKGDEDQELMLRAFSGYAHKITKAEITKIMKLIRMIVLEVVTEENIKFKETRLLSEDKRFELVDRGIDKFISKTKIDKQHHERLKKGCFEVYDQWKRTKRTEPDPDDVELYQLIDELVSSGVLGKKKVKK